MVAQIFLLVYMVSVVYTLCECVTNLLKMRICGHLLPPRKIWIRMNGGVVSSLDKNREESPGSQRARCRITSGERKLRESATESIPPLFYGKGEMVR